MIDLIKKRLVVVGVFFFLSLFAVIYANNTYLRNEKKEKFDCVETVSIVNNNHTVVLDAGHGEPDGGAVSINGTKEADINLKITLKIKDLLEQNGIIVILTRTDENEIYDDNAKTISQKKKSDLKNRVKIANESNADIYVSIHLNKINDTRYCGWQTFYKAKNESGKKLAFSIQNGMNNTIPKENKRTPLEISNIYIIDNITIPTCIVECGFLSNLEEEKQLLSDEYQQQLALGISNGIIDYLVRQRIMANTYQ